MQFLRKPRSLKQTASLWLTSLVVLALTAGLVVLIEGLITG
jgi:cytochrome c-type biogenesis protein CcmH/NrfF